MGDSWGPSPNCHPKKLSYPFSIGSFCYSPLCSSIIFATIYLILFKPLSIWTSFYIFFKFPLLPFVWVVCGSFPFPRFGPHFSFFILLGLSFSFLFFFGFRFGLSNFWVLFFACSHFGVVFLSPLLFFWLFFFFFSPCWGDLGLCSRFHVYSCVSVSCVFCFVFFLFFFFFFFFLFLNRPLFPFFV